MACRSRAAASSSAYRSIGTAYRARNVCAEASTPGLRKSRMDHSSASRFSTGVPVSAIRLPGRDPPHRLGDVAGAVLDVLRLVQHHPVPAARRPARRRRGWRSRRWSAARRTRRAGSAGSGRSAPCSTRTRSPGANRAASRCQLPEHRQRADQQRRPAPARAAAAPATARSCPDPCRRPGRRPGPAGRGRPARRNPGAGTAGARRRDRPARRAARAARPGRRRAGRRSSRVPPVAVTGSGSSSGGSSRTIRSASPAVIVPPPRRRKVEPGGQPLRIEVDPAPAQPDQRHLDPGQVGELVLGQHPAAQRQPPPVVHDGRQVGGLVAQHRADRRRGARTSSARPRLCGSRHQAGSRMP